MATAREVGNIVEREFTVTNKLGIHARVAAQIVKLASRFQSEIWFSKDGNNVNGKNILDVMTLECPQGSTVRVAARGIDAADAVQALAVLFQSKFGES